MSTNLILSEFPYHWPAGVIVKDILSKLFINIDNRYPSPYVNLIVDTTWGNSPSAISKLTDCYNDLNIDNLFFVSLFDPVLKDLPLPNKPVNFFQIGNINDKIYKKYQIDFHAIVVNKLFKKYSYEDLNFTESNMKYFLCYQNKPHIHRQLLTHRLIEENLLDHGIVTLQKNNEEFLYPNLRNLSIKENIESIYTQDHGITPTNNPYSLGETRFWQQSFLNVVSETFHNQSTNYEGDYIFISEKIYKPIIGMRPFVLNGPLNILNYLKENDFYTFEEYWKPIKYEYTNSIEKNIDYIIKVLKYITSLNNQEIKSIYESMLPKLIHNRERFFVYASAQENLITEMFVND